jgi:hypothetical protein
MAILQGGPLAAPTQNEGLLQAKLQPGEPPIWWTDESAKSN